MQSLTSLQSGAAVAQFSEWVSGMEKALKSRRPGLRTWGSGDALRRREPCERRRAERLRHSAGKPLQAEQGAIRGPAEFEASKQEMKIVPTMSRTQEVVNALTMLLPLFVAYRTLLEVAPTQGELVAASAIVLHFPFSFGYHVSCAVLYGRVHPVEDNTGLKLDLVFIHVAGSLLALATSGSLLWFAGNAAFNGFVVYRTATWSSSQPERQLCRLVCVLGYLLPVALVDSALFLRALLTFCAVGACFAGNSLLAGWGHALSHVLLAPFAQYVFAAAELASHVL